MYTRLYESPHHFVDEMGGVKEVDRLILEDEFLGPEYGAGTDDVESPCEVDLLDDSPTSRKFLPIALSDNSSKVVGFQFVVAGQTQATNLAKLPKESRPTAKRSGILSSTFSLGVMVIIQGERQEIIRQLFKGIFDQHIPEYTGQIIANPQNHLHPSDIEVYGRRKAAQTLARGMQTPTITLESANSADVETMNQVGQTCGWKECSQLDGSRRELGRMLMAPVLSLVLEDDQLQLQYRLPGANGIATISRQFFKTSMTPRELTAQFRKHQLVEPQYVNSGEEERAVTLQLIPDTNILSKVEETMEKLSAIQHNRVTIYRAILGK